ncbi:hypothetical protein M132_1567 [Bacteroides fragilis str. S24L15]|nr:hypothetical protein M132_1567 [Bacteroides fragilis str. S24L15]EYA74139.1 hypothetical protein M133_3834 [Bacteroides fragilis str. S24L26]EYA78635.1 hypothetical protein M134_3937 [Bacteroides fragilis str. S24L34]
MRSIAFMTVLPINHDANKTRKSAACITFPASGSFWQRVA